MKKTIKKFSLFLFSMILFSSSLIIGNTNEAKADMIVNDSVHYQRYIYHIQFKGNSYTSKATVEQFWNKTKGEPTFCIQADVKAIGIGADHQQVDKVPFMTDDVRKLMSIWKYYAFDKHNYKRYSLEYARGYSFTAFLHWEKLYEFDPSNFPKFTTDNIDVSIRSEYIAWRNEVEKQVNSYIAKPSFDKTNITLTSGESTTITDNNGVLKDFTILDKPTGVTAIIDGNSLKLTATNNAVNGSIKFLKNGLTSKSSWFYVRGTSQALASLSSKDPVISQVTINVAPKVIEKKGDLILKKTDRNGSPLPNAVINVYNNTTGTDLGNFRTGTNGEVVVPNLKVGDSITAKEINAPIGYILDETPKVITISESNNILTFKNDVAVAELRIIKIDTTTGAILKGAKFSITIKGESSPLLYYTTGTNIDDIVTNLKPNVYLIQEVEAPQGFSLDSTIHEVDLSYVNQNTPIIRKEITIQNSPSVVTLTKQDISTGEVLPGATIIVYREDGSKYTEGTTGTNGTFVMKNVPNGRYYFVETNAPIGYTINPNKHYFTVENGKVTQMDILKDTVTKVNVLKIDEKTKEPIKGVVFNILNSEKQTIKENLTTNDLGKIEILKLAKGNYFLQEVKTLSNYQLDSKLIPFIVGDTQVDIVVTNAKYSKVVISKVDISTKKAIPGALIEIYKENGELVYSNTSNKEGIVTFDKLTKGRYYFLEKNAPIGYTINPNKHFFEVTENGMIIKATLEDERNVVINKSDIDTTKPLPGAEFTLWNENGEIVYKGKTDENGQIKIALPIGKYRYEETGVPQGYDKSIIKSGIIEVKENGVKYVVKVTNQKVKLLPRTGEYNNPYVFGIGSSLIVLALLLLRKREKANN